MPRPTKYDPERTPAAAHALAMRGCTVKEIAGELGISQETLCQWRKRFPEFSEALKDGQQYAVAEVENALWSLATGRATQKDTHVREVRDADGNLVEQVKEVRERRCAPNMSAQAFYLKNRAKWSDNPNPTPEEAGGVQVLFDIPAVPVDG